MIEYALTTYDNDINPFDDFEGWFKQDLILGHNTCGKLSDQSGTSVTVSDEINNERIRSAMEYLVSTNPTLYKIVSKEFNKEEQNQDRGEGS